MLLVIKRQSPSWQLVVYADFTSWIKYETLIPNLRKADAHNNEETLYIGGQIYFGLLEYNKDLQEWGGKTVSIGQYLQQSHFIEAIFENLESAFLQMGLLVWFTIFLRQKGSSESKNIIETRVIAKVYTTDYL